MRINTAIELIENLVYFPGWEFEAEDHTKRFEGTVLLTVHYTAQETGRPNAAKGYPETIKTYAKFPLMVGDINSDLELYRRITQCLMRIYEHEMREALRVKGTLWAPFHPHALDGMKSWHITNGQPDYFYSDLQFGIG